GAAAAGGERGLGGRLAEGRGGGVVGEVTSTSPGLLVLADLFDRNWKAEIDGRPAELLRADGYFRAVAIAPGSHRVAFRYRPLSVWIGGGLSAVALLALAGLALGPREVV